jgi:hypothetical protein
MDYKKFCQLIDDEENERVDFKIQCKAFNKIDKTNAELVKDIVALANNGYVSSYLIIGVSDDRKQFKTVDNPKLIDGSADDRVQRLCRDNIFPVPKVTLTKLECLASVKIKPEHRGKMFIIIQVGPQIRQCFRFNRDLINFKEEYCFRKNEVWIRRGSTSDLASPEEIKRLLEGKAPIVTSHIEKSTDYSSLHREDVYDAICKDLQDLVSTYGGTMTVPKKKRSLTGLNSYQSDDMIDVFIHGKKLRLVLFFYYECNKYLINRLFSDWHKIAHGILLICTNNISKPAIEWFPIMIKEPWGFFCVPYLSGFKEPLPFGTAKSLSNAGPFCIALPKVSSTQGLHNAWRRMMDTLSHDTDIAKEINEHRRQIDTAFIIWLEEGCPVCTNTSSSFRPKRLKKNGFWNKAKYGDAVMLKQPKKCKVIKEFLSKKV